MVVSPEESKLLQLPLAKIQPFQKAAEGMKDAKKTVKISKTLVKSRLEVDLTVDEGNDVANLLSDKLHGVFPGPEELMVRLDGVQDGGGLGKKGRRLKIRQMRREKRRQLLTDPRGRTALRKFLVIGTNNCLRKLQENKARPGGPGLGAGVIQSSH